MKQLDLFYGISDLRFPTYHRDHPEIYEAFKKFTIRAMNKGFRYSSADFIFHIIRWETALTAADFDGFKVNNNFSSLYARMFMNEYPEHKGFFRTRKSKFDNQ